MEAFTLGDIKRDTFVVLSNANVLCTKHEASCTLCFGYGEKIPVGAFFSQIAGSAPNVAIGLAKLGHSTSVISTLPATPDAREIRNFLRTYKVKTYLLHEDQDQILSSAVVINFQGESTQLVAHSVTRHRIPKKLPNHALLHVAEMGGDYGTVFKQLLPLTKKHQLRLSMNPGMVQIQERKRVFLQLLQQSEILFVNMREARILTKAPANALPQHLMSMLRRLGPRIVIVTDGQKGAYASSGTKYLFAPTFPGKRIEATGAGDAFSTGVLAAWGGNASLEEALAWGSVNAASVIGFVGPTAGLLPASTIRKRLHKTTYCVTKL